MRIAMLTNNYKPFVGGVPISVERQAAELAKLGNDVTVFAPKYEEEPGSKEEDLHEKECKGRLRIIRFSTGTKHMKNGMVIPRLIPKEILRVFKEEVFDLIHTHHPMCVGTVALYLGKKYHLPVIYTYHTRYEDYLHYLPLFQREYRNESIYRELCRAAGDHVVPGYMQWFMEQCDLVLAPSAGMQDRIRQRGTRASTAVLPTGLKDAFYQEETEAAEAIRRKYMPVQEGYLFCTTGRLEKEKNLEFLLQGICRLKERMQQSFRVLLIGEGSMRKELEQEADRLRVSDVVCFVGSVPNEEVKRYLQACDIFLFASKSETQGIVLAEAMAAGCPVVAVRATGVEDIVKDGCNGFAVEEDPVIWAALSGDQ